jgi:nitrogen regulatory protein PII 2
MKEVMAVIRMNMKNKTKQALADAGIVSFYTKECLGRGTAEIPRRPEGAAGGRRDTAQEPDAAGQLVPMRMINLIVPDRQVKTVVNTVISVNRTGKRGDGKIFVMPVLESWRIRTGETGDEALDM